MSVRWPGEEEKKVRPAAQFGRAVMAVVEGNDDQAL